MTVRETLFALIEEERQFPHRTDAHLDECARLLDDLFAVVEAIGAAKCPPSLRTRAANVLARAEIAETLE